MVGVVISGCVSSWSSSEPSSTLDTALVLMFYRVSIAVEMVMVGYLLVGSGYAAFSSCKIAVSDAALEQTTSSVQAAASHTLSPRPSYRQCTGKDTYTHTHYH